MQNSRTTRLVTAGVMIAAATVLSMITIFRLPQGGGITAFSMLQAFKPSSSNQASPRLTVLSALGV